MTDITSVRNPASRILPFSMMDGFEDFGVHSTSVFVREATESEVDSLLKADIVLSNRLPSSQSQTSYHRKISLFLQQRLKHGLAVFLQAINADEALAQQLADLTGFNWTDGVEIHDCRLFVGDILEV